MSGKISFYTKSSHRSLSSLQKVPTYPRSSLIPQPSRHPSITTGHEIRTPAAPAKFCPVYLPMRHTNTEVPSSIVRVGNAAILAMELNKTLCQQMLESRFTKYLIDAMSQLLALLDECTLTSSLLSFHNLQAGHWYSIHTTNTFRPDSVAFDSTTHFLRSNVPVVRKWKYLP